MKRKLLTFGQYSLPALILAGAVVFSHPPQVPAIVTPEETTEENPAETGYLTPHSEVTLSGSIRGTAVTFGPSTLVKYWNEDTFEERSRTGIEDYSFEGKLELHFLFPRPPYDLIIQGTSYKQLLQDRAATLEMDVSKGLSEIEMKIYYRDPEVTLADAERYLINIQRYVPDPIPESLDDGYGPYGTRIPIKYRVEW